MSTPTYVTPAEYQRTVKMLDEARASAGSAYHQHAEVRIL